MHRLTVHEFQDSYQRTLGEQLEALAKELTEEAARQDVAPKPTAKGVTESVRVCAPGSHTGVRE